MAVVQRKQEQARYLEAVQEDQEAMDTSTMELPMEGVEVVVGGGGYCSRSEPCVSGTTLNRASTSLASKR